VVWIKKENMKLSKEDRKKINKSVIKRMNKLSFMIAEYSSTHSLFEIEAFRGGINRGIQLMSGE